MAFRGNGAKAFLRDIIREHHAGTDAKLEDLRTILKNRHGLECSVSLVQKAKEQVRAEQGKGPSRPRKMVSEPTIIPIGQAPKKPTVQFNLDDGIAILLQIKELIAKVGSLEKLVALATKCKPLIAA